MMKNRVSLVLALGAVLLLAGCDNENTPLAQRAGRVVDMGQVSLPNTTHRLQGYRLTNGDEHDHFVYVLLNSDGEPVAGTHTNSAVSSGKTTRNQAVSLQLGGPAATDVPDAAGVQAEARSKPAAGLSLDVKVACDSIEQCQRKLAAMQQTR